jgi:hypothetical protein
MGIGLTYPRVVSSTKYICHENARAPCKICGALATHKVMVEVDNNRKNNKSEPRCEEHRWK